MQDAEGSIIILWKGLLYTMGQVGVDVGVYRGGGGGESCNRYWVKFLHGFAQHSATCP